MKQYCLKCMQPCDFIDLNTGCCENCLPELGQEPVKKSRLVSIQTADGATRRAVVAVEQREARQNRK